MFVHGPSMIFNEKFLAEGFHVDLSQYDAIITMEWNVLFAADTSLDDISRAAFRVEDMTLTEGSHVARDSDVGITNLSPTEYANLTCDEGGYPCGAVARLLSHTDFDFPSQRPQSNQWVTTAEACRDFATGGYPGSSWTLDDCKIVWDTFALYVPQGMQRRFQYIDLWKDTAKELRRLGSPCLVAPPAIGDGVGSSTIRHLATWIYAEQLGCDWATPAWGRGFKLENGAVVYCHSLKFQKFDNDEERRAMNHCSVANWLSYFQFSVPSVAVPKNVTFRVIEV